MLYCMEKLHDFMCGIYDNIEVVLNNNWLSFRKK